jgi:uncharacterized membrane protein
MIKRTLFAILTGLAGAAVLHIIIVLALPFFTGLDAFTRLTSYDTANAFILFGDKPDDAGLSNSDPYLKVAACVFSVDDKPVRLTAPGGVPFWSFTVYDSDSDEVFSMNDRSASGGALDAIIASPDQIAEIRKSNPDIIAQSVLIEMPRPDGYIVLRTLSPTPSFDQAAKNFLSEAGCDEYDGG